MYIFGKRSILFLFFVVSISVESDEDGVLFLVLDFIRSNLFPATEWFGLSESDDNDESSSDEDSFSESSPFCSSLFVSLFGTEEDEESSMILLILSGSCRFASGFIIFGIMKRGLNFDDGPGTG
jgi:hypothetical protein